MGVWRQTSYCSKLSRVPKADAFRHGDWTLQQLLEVMGNGGGHRYLIHDEIGSSPSASTIRSEPWESRYCDRRWGIRKRIRFASASSAQRDVNA